MRYFKFNSLLQKQTWLTPAFVGVDDAGLVQYISDAAPDGGYAIEVVNGLALPGFLNAHSHAFQYAMAGLAENHPPGTDDDFWSWREAMYQCALSIDPDQAEAIAAMLYAEMLRAGYTHVAEFHYLHHDKNGKPYAHLPEMGERMISAASTAGINITLIPVFYQKGGFGLAPQARQRRFISSTTEDYLKLLEASRPAVQKYSGARLGRSVHSLRAVDLSDIEKTCQQSPQDLPFHLHIAEQKKEVSDCLLWCDRRPVQWLFENLPVDERFHLVHATHLNDLELKQLAGSKATVILCPSTEGNLGDGIFRMKEYCALQGHWTIGTDSHIGIDPIEEFRMIDYRQRLVTHNRNVFGNGAKYMINESITQGRASMGIQSTDHFALGQSFDTTVYDAATPLLADTSVENLLPTLVYAQGAAKILGVMVRGQWLVKNGRHHRYDYIRDRFSGAMKALANR